MREERVHREAHKRSALLFHFHIHHDIYKLLQQSLNRPEEEEKEEERRGGTRRGGGGGARLQVPTSAPDSQQVGKAKVKVCVCVNESEAFWVCAGRDADVKHDIAAAGLASAPPSPPSPGWLALPSGWAAPVGRQ